MHPLLLGCGLGILATSCLLRASWASTSLASRRWKSQVILCISESWTGLCIDNLVFKTHFSLNVVLHLTQPRLQPRRLFFVPVSYQLLLTPGFESVFKFFIYSDFLICLFSLASFLSSSLLSCSIFLCISALCLSRVCSWSRFIRSC